MENLLNGIQIQVNDRIYLKDPNSSQLGMKIVSQSLLMISDYGFEKFTFGKLAVALGTTESSIYRYFENKHKMLIYLTSWYWGWMEYQLVFGMTNVASAQERLSIAIKLLARDMGKDEKFQHIDLFHLDQVVISESAKAYLTKEVDASNREGFYKGYKQLVKRIASIILEINPDYKYAHTLVSTIVEGIHHQKYFADHLPALTDTEGDSALITKFYIEIALKTIVKSK